MKVRTRPMLQVISIELVACMQICYISIQPAKVQQKMHICKNFAQKFTFESKINANGLHNATVLSGECVNNSFELSSEIRMLFTQAASEGTTVSHYARAKLA